MPELIKKAPQSAQYPETVYATFDLAINAAAKASQAAEQVIELLAFFAPENVPLDLITEALGNEDERDDAVSALANVSLVIYSAFNDGSSSISLHRLVQEVARGRLGEKRGVAVSRGLDAMLAQWPRGNDDRNQKFWPTCSRLLPHALALLDQAKTLEYSAEKTAALLMCVGSHLNSRGTYSTVEPLFRRALEIFQRVLGEDHPSTASSYNNVAFNLDARGKYEEAEPLYRRALEIRQRVLGEDHPDTASGYNNVAFNLNAQGKYEEAERLYRRALEIWKSTLPPTHPNIQTVQTNLQQLHAKMDQ